MPQSIWAHPALVSIPAAIAVIIVTGMFLKHMLMWGKSRDAERESTMATISKMGSDFTDTLRQLNESRVAEQKEMMEFYRQQSLCMQTVIDQCGRPEGQKGKSNA